MADGEVEYQDWEEDYIQAEFPTGWEDDGGWEENGISMEVARTGQVDSDDDGFGRRSRAASVALTRESEPPAKKLRSPTSEASTQLNVGWESLLNSATSSATQGRMQMPWERGFAAQVFSNRTFVLPSVIFNPLPAQNAFPIPRLPVDIPISDPASTISTLDRIDKIGGAWPIVAGRMSGMNWDDKKAASRSTALKRLHSFFLTNPEATGLGRSLMSDILGLQNDGYINSVVNDVFARKATRTMSKRAADLAKFSLYCQSRSELPLPFKENLVYDYLRSHCLGSASAASNLCQAINFSAGTLQADGATEATSSPRVKGLTFRQALLKRPLRQAKLLKVSQVRILEAILISESEFPPDRVFSGHCLYCLHGRLRWSDGQATIDAELDLDPNGFGFVQTQALDSKTSTTIQKRTTFLPFTALANGIAVHDWAKCWLELRQSNGLSFSRDKPTMPAIDHSGQFIIDEELNSGDASRWLRELLLRGGAEPSSVTGISTHSLKSTTLSWAAKFGISRDARSILGYHVVAGSGGMLHYSRDEQALPLRKMQACYEEIRAGSFDPDTSRSGYFIRVRPSAKYWDELDPNISTVPVHTVMQPRAKRLPQPAVSEGEHMPHPDIDGGSEFDAEDNPVFDIDAEPNIPDIFADSSTSDSDSQSGDSDLVDEEIADIVAGQVPLALQTRSAVRESGERLYVHKLWKTIHKSHASIDTKLACGRRIQAGFQRLPNDCNLLRSRCIVCFGPVAV